MIRLSEIEVGNTVYVGIHPSNRIEPLYGLTVKKKLTLGTWQRVGLQCKLADFYAQPDPDSPPMAFRVIGQERKI